MSAFYEKKLGSKPCPACGENRCGVADSRPISLKTVFWKRIMHCFACGHRFTTHEMIVSERGLGVADSNEVLAAKFLRDIEQAVRDVAEKHYGDVGKLLRSEGMMTALNKEPEAKNRKVGVRK
jgi:transcriptional regulator NrdR family protein